MFNIAKISTPDNEPAIMLDVKNKKIGILSPLGPHGATYILAFPSLGYISLVDAGSTGRRLSSPRCCMHAERRCPRSSRPWRLVCQGQWVGNKLVLPR